MNALLRAVTRHRRALLFLTWAVTLLALVKQDRYQAFLRPGFGIILGAAYVILLLLLVAETQRQKGERLRGSQLLSPAILLLPILFVLNAQGAQLDSYAFEKRSVGTPRVAAQEPPSSQPAQEAPSPPADTAPSATSSGPSTPPPAAMETPRASRILLVTHLDLYNDSKRYEGKWISLIGMTYRNEEARKEFGSNAILVFRFVVTCCAADAQPIAVVVDRKRGQPDLPDNVWVKVQGHFVTRKLRGEKVPLIENAVLSPTAEPQPPYLY